MTALWQDLRYTLRVLRNSPGFTFVAVLTLALGIGANTAIFTVVYGVLLRPLPFPHSERIVQLVERYKAQSEEAGLDMSQFLSLQRYNQVFEHIAGYTGVGYNLAAVSGAEHLRGMPVSANYFQVLGIHPVFGRDFLPEEDLSEGRKVAILSYGLWLRRFAGDQRQIGQSVLLNGEPFTVIGVMPRNFDPFGLEGSIDPGAPDVWTPLALVAKTAGSGGNISVLARLKPAVTPAQLETQMKVVTQDLRKEYARGFNGEVNLSFLPYQRMVGAEVRPYLLVLLGAIGFVLMIACANVANLLLARSGLRSREIAVRMAIGASRSRLYRQLITESIVLGLSGGLLGLLLSYLGLGSLLAITPIDLPRSSDIHLDSLAFAFTFLVSILTGVIFGLVPAIQSANTDISENLKEGAGRSSAALGRARLRQALVVAEFAISLVLLTGAGLMIATFSRLLRTDPGFNPHPVLSAQFWLVGSKYNSTAQIEAFDRALAGKLQSLPGVDSAAVIAAGMPLERGGNNGVKVPPEPDYDSADYREITPGYFATLGIPLRQGRLFSDSDTASSTKVTIVNEALVRAHFGGRDPLHAQIFVGDTPAEVVGIVADVKSYLDQPAPPTAFVPAAQASSDTSKLFEGWFPRTVLIHSRLDPLTLGNTVRQTLAAVDPTIPVGKIRSMDQVLVHSVALRSFMMTLLTLFASLALVLACVGIYGVISYAVSQRTREIGVRMALGARRADVLRLVLAEAMKLILIGVALGVAAALALTKAMAGLLYGVSAADPFILLSVMLLLVIVSLAACYVPARRATCVDPIVALRHE
ncbi:MAG TPA: ABC transporter permease [Candidatus Acidoferrum sp.]|nr:ABC transporter permease [Candidatus Acidoferrum sp.]